MNQGALLKDEVRRLGITDSDFAAKCGVSRQTVSVWYGKGVLPPKVKAIVIAALQLQENFFTSKESPTYGINTDPSHILTAQEREALWNIINTQKELINDLKTRLKDDGSGKE